MPRRSSLLLLLTAAIVALSPSVAACKMVLPSVWSMEALEACSDVVVIGVIRKPSPTPRTSPATPAADNLTFPDEPNQSVEGGALYHLEIAEVLKGADVIEKEAAGPIKNRATTPFTTATGARVLTVAFANNAIADGARIVCWINRPASAGAHWQSMNLWPMRDALYNLADDSAVAWHMDGTPIRTGRAIGEAFREVCKNRPPPATRPAEQRLRRGYGGGNWQVLWGGVIPQSIASKLPGSGYGIAVPNDQRLTDLGRRWLREIDPDFRVCGASIIAGMCEDPPSPEVRRLLEDSQFLLAPVPAWQPQPERRFTQWFPVRIAAAQAACQVLGPGVAPVTHNPIMLYSPSQWSRWAWALAGLPLIIWLIPRKPRPGTSHLPARASLGVGVWLAALLGLAAVAVCALWSRSYRTADTWSFARGGVSTEIATNAGQLSVLRVWDKAPDHPLLTRSSPAPADPRPWFNPLLSPTAEWQKAGLSTARGNTIISDLSPQFAGGGYQSAYLTPPGQSALNAADHAFPYHLIQIPLWLPAALLGLWPVLFLILRLRGVVVRRRRTRTGYCPHCGYDRRGGIGPARPCAECGNHGRIPVSA